MEGEGGSAAAAASHSDDRADEDCSELWAIIAQVWRLGYVLLTHAGRCLLHKQLETVMLAQAAAAASLEGPDVSAAAAADGLGCAGASHLDSFAAIGMRLPPQTPFVTEGIAHCFELFSARNHADLVNNVCACVRVCICMCVRVNSAPVLNAAPPPLLTPCRVHRTRPCSPCFTPPTSWTHRCSCAGNS